jgi:hypothetical protein
MPLPQNPPMCTRWEIRAPAETLRSGPHPGVYFGMEPLTGRYAFDSPEAVTEFFMRYGGGEGMSWSGDLRGLPSARFPDFAVREVQYHQEFGRRSGYTITVDLIEIRQPSADERRILGLDTGGQPQAAQSRALDDFMAREMLRSPETFWGSDTWGSPQTPARPIEPEKSSAPALPASVPPQPQLRRRAIRV